MKTNKTTDYLFSFSSYTYVLGSIGREASDITGFIDEIKKIPEYQSSFYKDKITTESDYEMFMDNYHTTKFIAESFHLITPIVLYRIIENNLKKLLTQIYSSNLNKASKYKNRSSGKLKYNTAIKYADIKKIKELYKDSEVSIDIEKVSHWNIINEIRVLNNCLKHNNNIISSELSKINPLWRRNKQITAIDIQKRIADFDIGINIFFLEIERMVDAQKSK